MLKKVTYNGLRREREEEHCMIPNSNLIQKKKLKYRYLRLAPQSIDYETKFFRVKTKKPTRVIIKAPFHYKKGKHRLTLRSYRYVKKDFIPVTHSEVPHTMIDVIRSIDKLVCEIPSESTTILQPKDVRLYINYAIDKDFFLF